MSFNDAARYGELELRPHERERWVRLLAEAEADNVRLRAALRPFATAEHRVWKGTSYSDACRAAKAALTARLT